MSEARPQEHRFSSLFMWGGVLVAILGLALIAMGYLYMGIAIVGAGVVVWFLTKRRTRKASEGPSI